MKPIVREIAAIVREIAPIVREITRHIKHIFSLWFIHAFVRVFALIFLSGPCLVAAQSTTLGLMRLS